MTDEIPKVFTDDLLSDLSKSKSPSKLLLPLIHDHFKFLGPSITEDDSIPASVVSSLFLDTFAYFRFNLSLSAQQCSVFLDILLQLVLRPIRSSEFNKDADFDFFQSLVLPHAQGMNPLFPSKALGQVLKHMNLTYFSHYNLYKFLFTEPRSQEHVMSLLDIDTPLAKPAHSTATQRVFKETAEVLVQAESPKEVETVVVKENLRERLLKNMEENVREKFLEKVSEAREAMSRQLEHRDKMLKQKWEDLEKDLKRKRRRG
jgi:hypothetical protein